MAAGRIFFDVTYTRAQSRTVGIIRTVRRMASSLAELARDSGRAFQPVTFHRQGFRACDQGCAGNATAPSDPGGDGAGLLHFATHGAKPVIEGLLGLPWPLVEPGWAFASSLAFERAARGLPSVEFREGDSLLLFDAAWNYPVWSAASKARQAGAKVVTLVHDLMPIEAPQYCVRWVRGAFASWLAQAALHSDLILCNSLSTQAALATHARRHGMTLPPIHTLRLGNDLPAGADGLVRAAARRFAEARPFYAAIGTLEPKKNYALLLDAFEAFWRQGANTGLLLAGRVTPECRALGLRLRQLEAAGRPLLWLDDANDAEIAFMLGQARALVIPSLFEGFGLPLVEARAVGCPVIATDLSCFRELADDGVHLVAPGDPAALADVLARHSAGRMALSRTPHPGTRWSDTARHCLELVQRTLEPTASSNT
ncbi:MAG: glycosyltransferase family 1 protein [Pseudomonadota bacterium]